MNNKRHRTGNQTSGRAVSPSPESKSDGWKPMLLLGGLVAVVAIGIVMALLVAGDRDDTPAVVVGQDVEGETGPAQVIGNPLPRFDPAESPDPAIGTAPPIMSASAFDGSTLQLNPVDGTPRMIGFFAHWCPHCQREIPTVVEWMENSRPTSDLEVVAVSTAVDEGSPNFPPSDWFAREGFAGTLVRDNGESVLASAYGLSGFPYWVVTDADGKVVLRTSGEQTPEQLSAMAALATN